MIDSHDDLDECPEVEPCSILTCVDDANGNFTCDITFFLAQDHWGGIAFQLLGTGDLDWNELPFNIDAEQFEDAYLLGSGQACGVVSFTLPSSEPNQLTMICEDTTAGKFQVSDAYPIN